MRKSEMLALPLRYENEINGGLDLENGMFRIRQSVSESKYGIQLSPCKTDKSSRDIPIDKELLEILQTVEDKIYYKNLIVNMIANIWYRGCTVKSCVLLIGSIAILKNLKMILKPCTLAYLCSTLMSCDIVSGVYCIQKGVDIVTISKLMGHSSIEITVKLYVHDDMTLMQNAIETGFSGG